MLERLWYRKCARPYFSRPHTKRKNSGLAVLPHMRILAHTRMGRPIRVWDIPYAYGPILCPIRIWASHMSMHA